jgi:mannan endo-1,4-beta-mannosidase
MNRIFVLAVMFYFTISVRAQVIEAETGELSGTQKSTSRAGYSGTGFVTGFDNDGDKVSMTKTTTASGIYNLYVRYASPSGDKFNFIHVNGQNVGSAAFPTSASFVETLVGKIFLKQGANTIAIVKDWGYFDVDNIRLEKSTPSPYNNIAANLVTPSPSEEADSLYEFLSKVYGKVILSGQYGGNTELDRISNVSGKTPLIRGFDLMDYSPSRVFHGASSTETEKAIEWHQQKGLVTISWHWNAPEDYLIDQPGKEWWRGFYTEATTFDVSKAMNDVNSVEYEFILRDLDVIAVQLQKLEDAHVPVLWRPLHEAEGKWFWWGAKGADPCKWLWKLAFDRLVTHHGLKNLIWVWTSTGIPDALNWYPGDEYVDIIGADIYLPAGTYSSSFVTFDNMAALYQGRKIIALSENGPIPDAESLFQEGAAWSWFATWSGDFITDGVSNSAAHINTVFNHDYVITKDETNDIDAIIAALEERKEDEVVLGIDEPEVQAIIRQNPIKDRLIVTLKDPSTAKKIILYDARGQSEYSRDVRGERQLTIEFENRADGVYFLKVVTSKSVEVHRVVKIKH